MEATDLSPLIDDLSENIDELEEALGPILKSSLADVASKLPLLEKAKLQVLVIYAIESVLFSALKLNDIDARQHPVFNELTRVKQYFEKIKEVEEGGPKKRENLSLDKAAAGRLIKHALAGNPEGKPNTHIKFDQMAPGVGTHQRFKNLRKREAEDTTAIEATPQKSDTIPSSSAKKQRLSEGVANSPSAGSTPKPDSEQISSREGKRPKKEKKQSHKHKSSKPPKDRNTVFQELLKKPSTNRAT